MKRKAPSCILHLPGIDDEVVAWEAEQKGYFEASLLVGGEAISTTFYAASRLTLDAESAWRFGWSGVPLTRAIIVPSVTRQAMIAAVDDIERRDPGLQELLGSRGSRRELKGDG
jgi:hypothetical protein